MTTEEILQIVSLAICALCVIGFVLIATLGKKKTRSHELVFAAVSIALSFVLSFIKVKVGAEGGSVTLASFVPLIIYAYVAGARKGLLAGAIYGLLQIVEGGVWFVDVVQLLCDYILAFALIGLAPLFKNVSKNKAVGVYVGTAVAVFARFLMHTIAGMYFYPEMAFGDALLTSVVYNGTYMLPELVITLAVMAILVSTKRFELLTGYIQKAIGKEEK